MPAYSLPLLSFLFYISILFISSSFGSINLLRSSYQLFLQTLYGCIFIISSFIRVPFRIQKIILVCGFCIATVLFIGHSIVPSSFAFLPDTAYQFILRIDNQHNHLGDFAGLVFILLLLQPSSLILTSAFSLFTSIIMIISFSKSAFLGVMVILFVLAIKKKGLYRIGFFFTLFISLFVICIYTKELSKVPLIQPAQKIMMQTFGLLPKPILSVRDFYYPQVFRAWKIAPMEQLLFGYGLGNYIYPSIKTAQTAGLTPAETHNIFLSIFIESGILSLFWFLIFCTLIVSIGFRKKNPSLYLFLYLLINFQTDYTYIIPFFIGLFFFFAGRIVPITYRDLQNKWILKIIFFIFFLYLLYAGMSYFLIQQRKTTLEKEMETADKTKVVKILQDLEKITPYEEFELTDWASVYEEVGNYTEAARLLEKLSLYSPRWYLAHLPHLLDLQMKIKIDIKGYLESKKKDYTQFIFTNEEKKGFNIICWKYAKIKCIE